MRTYERSLEYIAQDANMLAARAASAPDYYCQKHVELLGSLAEVPVYRRILENAGFKVRYSHRPGSGYPEIRLRRG